MLANALSGKQKRHFRNIKKDHIFEMWSGDFSCCYCRETCATDTRFHLFLSNESGTQLEPLKNDHVGILYFCCPECAAGYNRYMTRDPQSPACGQRHRYLEKMHNRRIVCAPPPAALANRSLPRGRGMYRAEWIEVCRSALTEDEAKFAQEELLFNPFNEINWIKRERRKIK